MSRGRECEGRSCIQVVGLSLRCVPGEHGNNTSFNKTDESNKIRPLNRKPFLIKLPHYLQRKTVTPALHFPSLIKFIKSANMINQNGSEESKIYISNLPNTTPRQDILEYLGTAGPIKYSSFDESGQRLSATIVYYHHESAETAKKFLDQREFNTRKIKITMDRNRGEQIQQVPQMSLRSRFANLKKDERNEFFSYLKALRDQEGTMFEEFMQEHPELVDILLGL